jgi:hypothetical protein
MALDEEDITLLGHGLDEMTRMMGALVRTLDARLLAIAPGLRMRLPLPLPGGGKRLTGALTSLTGSCGATRAGASVSVTTSRWWPCSSRQPR